MNFDSPDSTSILMFHRVTPARRVAFGLPDAWRVRGTALSFAELLTRVGRRPVLPLADVVEALAAGRRPPPGVVLTFDDGYAEWVQIGAALARRGWPACFFWSRAMHAAGPLHPVDEYYTLLDRATCPEFEVGLPDGSRCRGDLRSIEGKRALVLAGPKPFIVDPRTARVTLDALAIALGVPLCSADEAQALYLDDAGRAELESQGHEIGAHGLRHVRLGTLGDDALMHELHGSRAWLGSATRWFAYPDGDFDSRVVAALRAVGFQAALTCEPRALSPTDSPFELPRRFSPPPTGAA